jgi:hypothetical protein
MNRHFITTGKKDSRIDDRRQEHLAGITARVRAEEKLLKRNCINPKMENEDIHKTNIVLYGKEEAERIRIKAKEMFGIDITDI